MIGYCARETLVRPERQWRVQGAPVRNNALPPGSPAPHPVHPFLANRYGMNCRQRNNIKSASPSLTLPPFLPVFFFTNGSRFVPLSFLVSLSRVLTFIVLLLLFGPQRRSFSLVFYPSPVLSTQTKGSFNPLVHGRLDSPSDQRPDPNNTFIHSPETDKSSARVIKARQDFGSWLILDSSTQLTFLLTNKHDIDCRYHSTLALARPNPTNFNQNHTRQ